MWDQRSENWAEMLFLYLFFNLVIYKHKKFDKSTYKLLSQIDVIASIYLIIYQFFFSIPFLVRIRTPDLSAVFGGGHTLYHWATMPA